jgi:hypothetical protein
VWIGTSTDRLARDDSSLRSTSSRANLDHRRAFKTIGFDLDVGGPVRPLLTPDDPNAFERVVRAHVEPTVVRAGARRTRSYRPLAARLVAPGAPMQTSG